MFLAPDLSDFTCYPDHDHGSLVRSEVILCVLVNKRMMLFSVFGLGLGFGDVGLGYGFLFVF